MNGIEKIWLTFLHSNSFPSPTYPPPADIVVLSMGLSMWIKRNSKRKTFLYEFAYVNMCCKFPERFCFCWCCCCWRRNYSCDVAVVVIVMCKDFREWFVYETGRMHITAAGDLFLRVKGIHMPSSYILECMKKIYGTLMHQIMVIPWSF